MHRTEKQWTWFCPNVSTRSMNGPDMEDLLHANGFFRDSLAHQRLRATSQRPRTLEQCKLMSTGQRRLHYRPSIARKPEGSLSNGILVREYREAYCVMQLRYHDPMQLVTSYPTVGDLVALKSAFNGQ
eukprot:4427370-Karenia_brevis.AAC.1